MAERSHLADGTSQKIDPEMLLKNYAVVFQDVLLFNASVMDNIKIGKKDATEEEVKAVARLARCDEFIARLPNGYDTLIAKTENRYREANANAYPLPVRFSKMLLSSSWTKQRQVWT